jgi:hypothetical protein
MFIAGFGSALLLPLIVLGQSNPGPQPVPEKADAARKFRAYLEADWKGWMELYPEIATLVGYPGQNNRWMDDAPSGIGKAEETPGGQPGNAEGHFARCAAARRATQL